MAPADAADVADALSMGLRLRLGERIQPGERTLASLASGLRDPDYSPASSFFQRSQAAACALRSASDPCGSSPWRRKPWPAPS
jgi:hypothetical protein